MDVWEAYPLFIERFLDIGVVNPAVNNYHGGMGTASFGERTFLSDRLWFEYQPGQHDIALLGLPVPTATINLSRSLTTCSYVFLPVCATIKAIYPTRQSKEPEIPDNGFTQVAVMNLLCPTMVGRVRLKDATD